MKRGRENDTCVWGMTDRMERDVPVNALVAIVVCCWNAKAQRKNGERRREGGGEHQVREGRVYIAAPVIVGGWKESSLSIPNLHYPFLWAGLYTCFFLFTPLFYFLHITTILKYRQTLSQVHQLIHISTFNLEYIITYRENFVTYGQFS